MKRAVMNADSPMRNPGRAPGAEAGSVSRPLLVVLALILLGIGLLSLRVVKSPAPVAVDESSTPALVEARMPAPVAAKVPVATAASTTGLSEATRSVLHRLKAPVEIRYYSLLKENQGTVETRAFAERVSELLAEYRREGRGLIRVNRLDSATTGREAAMAEGMEPLHLDRSGFSFLGIAVSCGEKRAVIPRLSSEWEGALEYDLSRAISKVLGGTVGGEIVVDPVPASVEATDDLLQVVPDLESLSYEEARQRVQDSAREEFQLTVKELQRQLLETQRRLDEARRDTPDMVNVIQKELQSLQTAQTAQLAELSKRMRVRLAALERLKSPL